MNSIICVLIIVIGIIISLFGILVFCIQNKKIELGRIELFNSIDFDQKIELLDKIISESFSEWKLQHIDIDVGDEYITSEMQKDMINIITAKSLNRITYAIRVNLALVYNIDTEEDLINIIGLKTGFIVMNYVSDKNSEAINDENVIIKS